MLGRASSDAGTRLRRSKSTSTVHRRPPSISEPPLPNLAQQQALAAATVAYIRAHTQDAPESRSKRDSGLARSKSNASRKSLSSQGSHFPPRDPSFRSLQTPTAGPVTDSHQRPGALEIVAEQFPPFYPVMDNNRPVSAPQPLSAQPSVTFNDTFRPVSQGQTQRTSASSSITSQQIRKARSMYYASSVQTGSPIARPLAKYLTKPPAVSTGPVTDVMPLIPSSRTLRPSPLVAPRLPVSVAAGETVNQARDKYLQTIQQKSVKHKPSVFLAPFKKRQEKRRDNISRSSSGKSQAQQSRQQTPGDCTTDVTHTESMPQPGPKEKRSFSGSLKRKFKRVFRRSSNRYPTLPVQQIEASRDYHNNGFHGGSVLTVNTYDIPSPDEDTLQRVRSRTPSIDDNHRTYRKTSSQSGSNGSQKSNKSNRSLHSETNAVYASSSRVTSWGTASTSDPVTQRALKRLTVIHEAKDSIGSETDRVASMAIRRKSLPPLAAFRDPMPMKNLVEETIAPVDPKRVFSALMREIEATKPTNVEPAQAESTPGAESDVFKSSATKVSYAVVNRDFRPSIASEQRPPSRRPASTAAGSAQSKNSTIRSLGKAIRTTIRAVTPTGSHSSPIARKASQLRHSQDLPKTPDSDESQKLKKDIVLTSSATQIEERVRMSDDRWQTPVEHSDKPQFAKETDGTFDGTDFVHQSMHDTVCSNDQPWLVIESLGPEQGDKLSDYPKANTSPSPRPLMSPLSPSVYSRNTDGISILPNDSVMSFNGPNDPIRTLNGGSAVILKSQSVRSYVIGTPSPRRPDSTRMSRDWKAWLSHEISGMESLSPESLKIDEQYTTPTRRDQRDSARESFVEDEDTTVILRASCETITPRQASDLVKEGGSTSGGKVMNRESSTPGVTKYVLEKSESHPDTFKEVSPFYTPSLGIATIQVKSKSRPGSTPGPVTQRVPSTPSSRGSSSQRTLETPNSARMNDRFPYISKVRRSSNNSAASSRHSKSPVDSVASLESTSSKVTANSRIYSELPLSRLTETPQKSRNTALRRSDAKCKRKENVTPPSIHGDDKLGDQSTAIVSQASALQPLLVSAINLNTLEVPRLDKTRYNPVGSPNRPRVRASLRPISPEKLSRRPRSAFDLRANRASQGPLTLYQTNITELQASSLRPLTELRRPALHIKTSSSSLAQAKEPSPVAEERAIDSVIEERPASVTPGQRMVDRFLKERKSTGVLESRKMRGGLRLAREDTPAFL
ncbi:hypothetical protein ACN47E_006509 [Coniothyrium glycines]